MFFFLTTTWATTFTEIGGSSGLAIGGIKDGGVCSADFNSDGWPDLYFSTQAPDRSYLLLHDGVSGWTDQTLTLAPGTFDVRGERKPFVWT